MPPRRWVLSPLITAGFALAFVLLLVAGGLGYRAVELSTAMAAEGRLAREVLDASQQVMIHAIDVETSVRGYLLEGAARDLASSEEARRALTRDLGRLGELVAGTPDLQRLHGDLRVATEARLSQLDDVLETRRREGPAAALRAFSNDRGGEGIGVIRSLGAGVAERQRAILARTRVVMEERRLNSGRLLLLATLLGSLLAAFTLVALNQQTQRRMTSETERERLVREQAALEEAARTAAERERVAEALRVSEEEFRAMFMQSPLGMARVDPSGRHLRVNPSFCAMTGYAEAELVGMAASDLTAPADRGERSIERRLVRKDGSSIWVHLESAVIRDAEGRALHTLEWVTDITQRKQADTEREALLVALGAAREQAENANRAKDELLAVLSHELRNPLAPIQTALELMADRDPATASSARRTIEQQVRHMVRLVDDLLDVARIARGKVELRKQRLEIAEAVAKAIEMASPLLERTEHRLTVEVPPHGLAVDGDLTRLSQVVANLVVNAAKYTERGGHITVRAAAVDGEVTLEVADDGIGITAEMLPRVFDMFVQENQSSDRALGGLGLGLAIVRNLVVAHGGSVAARSEGKGRGSTFTVRLPAAAPVVEATPRPGPSVTAAPAPAPAPRLSVLVVDDNVDAALLLRMFLTSLGHTVKVAHDGPSALAQVADFTPDLAFLDIGLPVMDGYELARRLRLTAGLEQIRLVAVSGYGEGTDRRRSEAAGFDLHLVKPVSRVAFEGVLATSSPRAPR